MNKRLDQLYQMIPKDGIGIIDIGTDHGSIPIQLAASGYAGTIYASDIVPSPLNAAREAARKGNVENRIRFLLCDGLDQCPPDEVDCILIAGMGGDTICGILDRADWIFSDRYLFLFQPMTKPEVLRYWLIHNEFQIITEAVVTEDKHIYQIFSAKLGKSRSMKDAEYLIGSCSSQRAGESVLYVINEQLKRIEKKLHGLETASDTANPGYEFYAEIKRQLEKMLLDHTELKDG